MTLTELKSQWDDTPVSHVHFHELFTDLVNKDDQLREHRDWVSSHIFGFGEKSFWWLWKMIMVELPEEPKLLEIGVFRAATMSLWKLLNPKAKTFGVTPLDSSGGVWESNYAEDIKLMHDTFSLGDDYTIYQGLSNAVQVVKDAFKTSPYDCVYVDGGHSFEEALFDLETYGAMVKVGGYLVIDDCNCDLNFPPSGFFTGIADVTDAKRAWWEINKGEWGFMFSCVHISVYRRIK